VNFNGSGGGIRGNGNVSSITVNGTGDYTVNFTTAMPDANLAVITSTSLVAGNNNTCGVIVSYSTTNARVQSRANGGISNVSDVHVSIFR
jgi:hypothetical protein